jgi:hypothetical protein
VKRQLGKHRRRWKDIRVNDREIGWDIVDWTHLAQERPRHRREDNIRMDLREIGWECGLDSSESV